MFTAEQIKAAHAKVKSGADFPNYIGALKSLGIQFYETYVWDGHTDFHGNDGYKIITDAKYERKSVADIGNVAQLMASLAAHQQGHSDYPTFCKESAENGVEKWRVDMAAMTCSYYDKAGKLMFSEAIPQR